MCLLFVYESDADALSISLLSVFGFLAAPAEKLFRACDICESGFRGYTYEVHTSPLRKYTACCSNVEVLQPA